MAMSNLGQDTISDFVLIFDRQRAIDNTYQVFLSFSPAFLTNTIIFHVVFQFLVFWLSGKQAWTFLTELKPYAFIYLWNLWLPTLICGGGLLRKMRRSLNGFCFCWLWNVNFLWFIELSLCNESYLRQIILKTSTPMSYSWCIIEDGGQAYLNGHHD